MTANQIAYAKVREDQRHNVATERETGRHNVVSERQKDRDIAIGESTAVSQRMQAETAQARQQEDVRHNFEQEGIDWWKGRTSIQESQRHNLASEGTEAFKARSLAGYQSAQSEAVLRQAGASERQAAASERSSSAALTSAGAAYQSALAAGLNAQTRASELQESIRHSTVTEAETTRHNKRTENAQSRQSLASLRSAEAAASQAATSALRQKAEEQIGQRNATSQRITAVSKAVGTGVDAGVKITGLARSIIGGMR